MVEVNFKIPRLAGIVMKNMSESETVAATVMVNNMQSI